MKNVRSIVHKEKNKLSAINKTIITTEIKCNNEN